MLNWNEFDGFFWDHTDALLTAYPLNSCHSFTEVSQSFNILIKFCGCTYIVLVMQMI